MSTSMVHTLLEGWEKQGKIQQQLVNCEVQLTRDDLAKIEALSEVYQLPKDQLLASLINKTLLEIEERMPYVAGNKIIREEEGEPVYEDIGPTPAYLKAKYKKSKVLKGVGA